MERGKGCCPNCFFADLFVSRETEEQARINYGGEVGEFGKVMVHSSKIFCKNCGWETKQFSLLPGTIAMAEQYARSVILSSTVK